MTPSTKSWGYVYLVRSHNRIKIGWTGNLKTLQSRLRRLHTLNAYGIELLFVIRSRRSYAIEAQLHSLFDHVRAHGEWFTLTTNDIATIEGAYRRQILYPDEVKIELLVEDSID